MKFIICGKVMTYFAMSDNNSLIKLCIGKFLRNFF